MKVHFVGVNGSGCSGVACAAKKKGFEVTGCDVHAVGSYTFQLNDCGIYPIEGHSVEHIKDADIVAVSPAFLYDGRYRDIPELATAERDGKLMKWQEFLGRYLFKDGKNIAVCATHGKTTTTSMLGVVLDRSGFDPSVFVGGVVGEWNASFRVGQSDWNVVEADEYDFNFIHYNPRYVILNNLEMEHPERFKDYEAYKDTFRTFLRTIQENGEIILNLDDAELTELVGELRGELLERNVRFVGYTIYGSTDPNHVCDRIYDASVKGLSPTISFAVDGQCYTMNLMGEHNIANAVSVIALCTEIGVKRADIKEALANFQGSKRRLECLYDDGVMSLYSDYAHHHAQVAASVSALQTATGKHIVAVLEPHQVSRIANHAAEYVQALEKADHYVVTEIFKGREANVANPDMDKITALFSDKGSYTPDYDELMCEIEAIVADHPEEPLAILVMGAGNSYKVADKIKATLEFYAQKRQSA